MSKFGRKLLAALLVGTMTIGLIGCGGDKKTSKGGVSETDPAGEKRDIIVLCSRGDAISLDPHKENDTASALPVRAMYEQLIRLNPETDKFDPYLAESWEYLDEDQKKLKMKLVEGVKFHNGNPLTAEDVKYSLDRQKKSGKVGHLVKDIESVEVIDDYNFVIHLAQPTSAILSSLSHMGCSILDKEYTEKIDAEGKSLDKEPNGTGPFKFDHWKLGSEWQVVKNDDYWNDKFMAQSKGIICIIKEEETARTVAIQTGEADVLLEVPSVDIKKIKDDDNLELMKYTSTALEFIGFNCSKPPFDNKDLREAVSYCINRDDIIQVQHSGEAIPVHTCIGPAAIGYTDDVVKREADLKKAKQKLKDAGKPDGFKFELDCRSASDQRAGQVIQAACKKAGIEVEVKTLEKSAFFAKIGNAEHEAVLTGWIANAEPENTYSPLFSSATIGKGGSNSACFKSEEIDKLIIEGMHARDEKEKNSKYEEIAKIVAKECAVCPICSENGYIARNKKVDGMIISSIRMHELYGLHFVK